MPAASAATSTTTTATAGGNAGNSSSSSSNTTSAPTAAAIDPHLPPPAYIKAAHKALQHSIYSSHPAPTSTRTLSTSPLFTIHSHIPASLLRSTFAAFSPTTASPEAVDINDDLPVYTAPSHPGLYIIPSLLPTEIQRSLLSSLLITHLSATTTNNTNLHLHYRFPAPPFSVLTAPDDVELPPKDPQVHKPLTAKRARDRKLRWMTLGGQYDWTKKRYPESSPSSLSPSGGLRNGGGGGSEGDAPLKPSSGPPPFPPDLANLVHALWPELLPQAAIVNVYSPGDTLAPHRDVAETSNAGLVSLSIGCDGVFMIARPDEGEAAAGATKEVDGANNILSLVLHSGDMVVMSSTMRRAWHSVPKIVAGTCPGEIEDWPGDGDEEEEAGRSVKGWMRNKRINFNIRQMWD